MFEVLGVYFGLHQHGRLTGCGLGVPKPIVWVALGLGTPACKVVVTRGIELKPWIRYMLL